MRSRLVRCAFVLVVGWLAVVPTLVSAAEIVGQIEVAGNRRFAGETVISQSGLRPGAAWSAAAGNEALKALFATGFYSDVRIDRRGTVTMIRVTENPVIASVSFEGNTALDSKALAEDAGIKGNDVYTRAKAHEAAAKLLAAYAKKGRNRTLIEPQERPRADGRVDLVFVVKEAEVSKIVAIRFKGNSAFKDEQLKDAIASAESSWMDFIKTNTIYDKERVDLDRDMLGVFYVSHGYADARVVSVEAVLDEAAKGYVVTFTVEEGEPYHYGAVAVEPKDEHVDAAGLAAVIKTRQGELYDARQVEATLDKLNAKLAENGPTFLVAGIKPNRDPKTHTMGLTYVVEEGPHVRIERIEVRGNAKTNATVILRELKFAEGDPLNASLVARAKAKLKALGFFKTVDIQQARGSGPDKAVVTIVVEEQETQEVGFGIGYSENDGITGDISYEERNLMGNGQYVKVKLAGSQTSLKADLGFTEPHFLGSNVAAGFDLFYHDTDNTLTSSYMSTKVGGDVRLGFALTDEVSASVNYTFVRSTIYNVGANASAAIKEAVPGYPNTTSNTYNTSSIGYSLAYDTRDNKRNPTEGVYLSTTQDFAGVGGDVRYLRTVAEARAYYALTKDITLAGRAIGGTIVGWGGDDVRLLDMFYKGGETVRGFAVSGIGPRDMLSANQDALGGSMFYATSLEARFPIPGVPDSAGVRGSVFADAGSLWGAGTAAQKLPGLVGNTPALRASTGVGVAWDSPIGPLQLSYAVPLVKQAYDKTQPLSFGLASGF